MRRLKFLFLFISISFAARADVKLAAVFSDHAVLQRDKTVPVWGTAEAGEKVTVEFAGQKKETTADEKGHWVVKLDPLKANAEAGELKVTGKNSITLKDILVGEVWVASGQSNMGFTLARSTGAKEEIEKAKDPLLRWLFVGNGAIAEPTAALPAKTAWVAIDSSNAGTCSGVAYFFAKEMRRTQNVPVGIVGTHVGGTAAEQWTDMETLKRDEFKSLFASLEQKQKDWDSGKLQANYEKQLENHKKAVEKAKAENKPAPNAPRKPQNPSTDHFLSGLFNGKVAPLQPYAMRGVIWYQGESNGTRGAQYKTLFPAMIDCWRKTWAQPAALRDVKFDLPREDFPFLFVQLPNFNAGKPDGTQWAELREAQVHTLKTVPNTGMAIALDVGDPKDIHPVDKKPVGERLGIVARALVYGEKIEPTGPLFESMKIDGAKAVISFKHKGGGLISKTGETLKGFQIAEKGKGFVAADAKIDGDTVSVWSVEVKEPAAVRYAFINAPEASLFSKEGIPASPFRTDDWALK